MGFLNGMLGNPNVAAGAGAVGDLVEGFAGGRAADFQAQIARNNAEIARMNARQATEVGNVQALNSMLKTRAQVGYTKAAQAAGGVDVNSGSALDVQASERMLGMMDALTIRSNAARQAYGYQAEGRNYEAQSESYKRRGKMSRISGLMAGSSTILEGASSVDRMRRQWQDIAGDDEEMPSFGGGVRFGT